jgi:hypothetical protein
MQSRGTPYDVDGALSLASREISPARPVETAAGHTELVYRFSKIFPLGLDFRYHESWQGNPVLLD